MHKILDGIEEGIPNADEFTDYELRQLEQFSICDKEEIRSRVAVVLAGFTEERGEQILSDLTKDKEPLVRVEACDSLRQSKSLVTYDLLMTRAKQDKNGMVRGYAISSLSEIAFVLHKEQELIVFLTQRLLEENVIFTKVNIYKTLYDMGEYKYLDCLLNSLNAKAYQNRCAVVNLPGEIIDKHNYENILRALKARKEIEKTIAVNSSIDRLLEKMKA